MKTERDIKMKLVPRGFPKMVWKDFEVFFLGIQATASHP